MQVLLQEEGQTTFHSTCPYEPDESSEWSQEMGMPVYPNPVVAGSAVHLQESFLIAAEENGYTDFYLVDVQGAIIRTGKVADLHQGLTMPGIPGIYHLVVEGKAGRKQFKIAVGR